MGSVESGGSDENVTGSQARIRETVRQSCLAILEVGGPLLRSPVIGVHIVVRRLLTGRPDQLEPNAQSDSVGTGHFRFPLRLATSQAAVSLIRAAVANAITNTLGQFPSWCLMEPMIQVELRLPANIKGRLEYIFEHINCGTVFRQGDAFFRVDLHFAISRHMISRTFLTIRSQAV